MRIEHIVASITDQNAGPSHTVPGLCTALLRLDTTPVLHTISGWRQSNYRTTEPQTDRGFEHLSHKQNFAGVPGLNRLCLSFALKQSLMTGPKPGVIHSHGLWLMPNFYAADIAFARAVPLVTSVRGMLGPPALKFSALPKVILWQARQAAALKAASALHATSDIELHDIRARGLRNPVAVISNGIVVPDAASPQPQKTRTVLSLGRIHPKKNLDLLLKAWSKVETSSPGWQLRIAGPDEGGHLATLKRLAKDLNVRHVTFEGPLHGEEKEQAYGSAELFVLPSSHENFAMTVAEALAAGVPVLCSKGAPWQGLIANDCGWWVDTTVDAFAAALAQAIILSDDVRHNMGINGRHWMERAFSWNTIARQMLEVYEWVQHGGTVPSTVHVA